MDTIQPPILEPSETKNTDTQSAANQPKHSDTRVALSVTEKESFEAVQMRDEPAPYRVNTTSTTLGLPKPVLRQNQPRKTARKQISPTTWVQGMQHYVMGKVSCVDDVAEYIGCSISRVRAKAQAEGWTKMRDEYAAKLKEHVQQMPRMEWEIGKEELERLGGIQVTLADKTFVLGHSSASVIEQATAAIEGLILRLPESQSDAASLIATKLNALVSVRSVFLSELRILAGLPDPDKVRPTPKSSPAQDQPKQTQPKARPEPTGPISQPIHASPVTPEQDQDSEDI